MSLQVGETLDVEVALSEADFLNEETGLTKGMKMPQRQR